MRMYVSVQAILGDFLFKCAGIPSIVTAPSPMQWELRFAEIRERDAAIPLLTDFQGVRDIKYGYDPNIPFYPWYARGNFDIDSLQSSPAPSRTGAGL